VAGFKAEAVSSRNRRRGMVISHHNQSPWPHPSLSRLLDAVHTHEEELNYLKDVFFPQLSDD